MPSKPASSAFADETRNASTMPSTPSLVQRQRRRRLARRAHRARGDRERVRVARRASRARGARAGRRRRRPRRGWPPPGGRSGSTASGRQSLKDVPAPRRGLRRHRRSRRRSASPRRRPRAGPSTRRRRRPADRPGRGRSRARWRRAGCAASTPPMASGAAAAERSGVTTPVRRLCCGRARPAATGMSSASRSAATIVGRFVFARGHLREHRGVRDVEPVEAEHAAVRVDDRGRVVGRAHAAGRADMAGVADGLHQPARRSPRRRTARRARARSCRSRDGRTSVSNAPLRSSSSARLTPSRIRTRSPWWCSMSWSITGCASGSGGGEPQPAAPLLLVDPDAQQAGTAGGAAAAGAAPRAGRRVLDRQVRGDLGRQRERLVDRGDHHVVLARVRPDPEE